MFLDVQPISIRTLIDTDSNRQTERNTETEKQTQITHMYKQAHIRACENRQGSLLTQYLNFAPGNLNFKFKLLKITLDPNL